MIGDGSGGVSLWGSSCIASSEGGVIRTGNRGVVMMNLHVTWRTFPGPARASLSRTVLKWFHIRPH
jgi:hypothetical protein